MKKIFLPNGLVVPAHRAPILCGVTAPRLAAVAPSARVVYADNDPLVLAHARALLTSSPEGRTAYIQADLRDPESILANPVVREVLDFSQPVALMLVAILHFIPDEAKPAQIVAILLDALPTGSYLVASHGTTEHDPVGPAVGQAAYRSSGVTGRGVPPIGTHR